MGAPDVLSGFLIAAFVIFLVAYGYRLRMDVYLIAGAVLSPHRDRLRKMSLSRRVLVFIGMPLDGILYLAYSLLPWAPRQCLFAGLVADTVALYAAHSGLSWEQTHQALVKAVVIVLGDDAPEVNQQIVDGSRKKFEAHTR